MLQPNRPEISILVTTYERPYNLLRVLVSLAVQQGVDGMFEVIVCDDGSKDETPDLVHRLATQLSYPLRFATHAHDGFLPSRCRNEGAAMTTADYLLFLDGDCAVPKDHVWQHLQHRQPHVAMAGYCYWFDQATSSRITPEIIRSGAYVKWTEWRRMWDLKRFAWKSHLYSRLHHPTKPKLFGGNAGIWHADYERVNGYDEQYVGWGCEDDDFRIRLRRAGVRVQSILRWTNTYHLWHPRDVSAPVRWSDGPNVTYHHRPIRLTRCRHGMHKRPDNDLQVRVVGTPTQSTAAASLIAQLPPQRSSAADPEIEIAFLPGDGTFSGRADCNVLVILDETERIEKQARQADILVTDAPHVYPGPKQQLPLHEFKRILKAVA